jgi:hypothetical protein
MGAHQMPMPPANGDSQPRNLVFQAVENPGQGRWLADDSWCMQDREVDGGEAV